MLCVATGFFAFIGYNAYRHYTDKYVHVEVTNCSNTKVLTNDTMNSMPALKKALKIAEKEGRATLKISVEEFNKMKNLSGCCIKYNNKTYIIYLVTP